MCIKDWDNNFPGSWTLLRHRWEYVSWIWNQRFIVRCYFSWSPRTSLQLKSRPRSFYFLLGPCKPSWWFFYEVLVLLPSDSFLVASSRILPVSSLLKSLFYFLHYNLILTFIFLFIYTQVRLYNTLFYLFIPLLY